MTNRDKIPWHNSFVLAHFEWSCSSQLWFAACLQLLWILQWSWVEWGACQAQCFGVSECRAILGPMFKFSQFQENIYVERAHTETRYTAIYSLPRQCPRYSTSASMTVVASKLKGSRLKNADILCHRLFLKDINGTSERSPILASHGLTQTSRAIRNPCRHVVAFVKVGRSIT